MGSYKIRLIKSWTNKRGRKYPVGFTLVVDNVLGSELIEKKYGVKYDGEYPPQGKVKTEFFKPK